jgi:membrane protein
MKKSFFTDKVTVSGPLQRGISGAVLRFIKILAFAVERFASDRGYLRASALTFYSALSIVPVAAMLFGIASGFGLDALLRKKFQESFHEHQEVVGWVIRFSESLLQNTRGEMIAGAGVIILFWTLIRVTGNIEESFNNIWRVKRARSFFRKLTDYLSMLLICPAVIILSSSINVYISAHVTVLANNIPIIGDIDFIIFHGLKIVPFLMASALFTFTYMFVPNTRVQWKAGLVGGLVCGALFQLLQSCYIFIQVALSKYNAIYGSFSALPLFLIWLQLSWIIVLFGAEISYVVQNFESCVFERDNEMPSGRLGRLLALRVMLAIVRAFRRGTGPLGSAEAAAACQIPPFAAAVILRNLTTAGLLCESTVRSESGRERAVWQLVSPPETVTASAFLARLDDPRGESAAYCESAGAEAQRLCAVLDAFDSENGKSKANLTLDRLAD